MKKWYELESRIWDQEIFLHLVERYNSIYKQYEALGELKINKLNKIKEDIEYQILRLIFINPVHLPIMTEGYLRKDFHFAMYLGYCYGKTLTNFFKWSLLGLIVALLIVIIVFLSVDAIPNEDAQLYFSISLLLISFISLILITGCLTSAEKKLTPSVFDDQGIIRKPDRFNICFNQRRGPVDPFTQLDELPRMYYMDYDEKNNDLNNAERN